MIVWRLNSLTYLATFTSKIFTFLLVLFSISNSLYATVDTVKVTTDGVAGSLRSLVQSGTADTIVFDPSTNGVNVTISMANPITIDRDVVIIGNGKTTTIIDAASNSSAIYINSGYEVEIQSLSIQNGLSANDGGAIFIDGAVVRLVDVGVSRSTTTERGGGIYNRGSLSIYSSMIISNTAQGAGGGGIYNDTDGQLYVENSMISTNRSPAALVGSGGGIANYGGMIVIMSTIDSNSATSRGGGVYGQGRIEQCLITNNTSSNGAGVSTSGNMEIILSTVSGNSGFLGGGIAINEDTTIIVNCGIHGNFAEETAGGIFAGDHCTWGLFNSTIAENYAISAAGGVFNETERMTLKSTIIVFNATNGSNPDLGDAGLINNLGHNLVFNADYGNFIPTTTDIIGASPNFVMLSSQPAPSTSGDYNLQSGSPAIDAGMVVTDTTPGIDLDLDPRVFGSSADIGAFEYRSSPTYSFGDPCDCSDPANFEVNGSYFFHDVITYVNSTADTVLIDSISSRHIYDMDGRLYGDSIAFTEVNDSTFVLDYWRQSGLVPDLYIYVRSGTSTTRVQVIDASFGTACTNDCPPAEVIPTLSEWGVLYLFLSLLILSVLAQSDHRVKELEIRL